ncbi:hypothetical protein MAPG_08495 [Magnaporthiopsis poae ATCC 64411]|uniref:CHAT domain-containing protein n=1 Tax=Magnaporthiopsis poae (strain ATCC 64411 / 73-15) TaxID=644358 RepID=A0A0C4E7I2_MAGP6|nr:hypothetical protein MAPG_08495 [Magnaporthiopsis poae ATCC 64411]
MTFTLRISGLGARSTEPGDGNPTNTLSWPTELASSNGRRTLLIADPLLNRGNPAKDQDLIKWYLEKHVSEPFEATEANSACRLIREYGQGLALQISSSGLLPAQGHLEIEVGTPDGETDGPGHAVSSLQRLHWEVLEDVTLWPEKHKFRSVGVCRTTTSAADTAPAGTSAFPQIRAGADALEPRVRKYFNILLVVSRPGGSADVEHQLVSRCLVDIADRVSKASPDLEVVLEVLRPPTWAAFQACLGEDSARRYDLVHLDMHGAIREKEGVAKASLCFCGKPKPKLSKKHRVSVEKEDEVVKDWVWKKEVAKDWVSGEEVAKVLSRSGVRTVILNACESANSRRGDCGGNLAAILLRHLMDSVVAMSFKVVDEAVEIFTDVFYTSLLLDRRPVEEATRLSRLALLRNPQRRARHMYSVRLMDYIVPVLYRRPRNATDDLPKASGGSSPNRVSDAPLLWDFMTFLWNFATMLWKFAALLQNLVLSLELNGRLYKLHKDSVDREIIGRDADILHIESALSVRGLLLLHGPGGCGKTALIRYCAQWWQRSGWIKQSATVDFARSSKETKWVSFQQILGRIATQLQMPSDHRSELQILDKLRGEACLLVLDSLESLSSAASQLELMELQGDGLSRLREFVWEASRGKSKIILVSRHRNDPFIDGKCLYFRYQLAGLSVLGGAQLLEQLAYGKTANVPEALRHRQNIDLIRRAVILLEGNPAVLRDVGPVLRRLGHDIKAFYDKLLFGVCDGQEGVTSRFARTIAYVCAELEIFEAHNDLVFPFQVAPFWTIAPSNPQYYFWFLYLGLMPTVQEGSYASWLTDDFRAIVELFQRRNSINMHWDTIFRRFESAGLAEEATIETNAGAVIRCYHVHPMVTLRARAQVQPELWPKMKFAFVRQFLLWFPKARVQEQVQQISSVTWDDVEQHDDYAENCSAAAMAFALEGPDFQGEVERMGWSLFDFVHLHSLNSFLTTARRAEALRPFVQCHLKRLFDAVEARSNVPTSYELGMIMNYSWECYNHEQEVTAAADIVGRALEVLDRYQALVPSRGPLTPTQDLTVFQLRYAEACIVNRRRGNMDGMEYFQRNLEQDVGEDHYFYAAIRRVLWRCLLEWTISASERMPSVVPPQQQLGLGRMQAAQQLFDDPSFREGGVAGVLAATIAQHPELLDRTPVKESIAPVLEANQGSVARFGKIAHRILNESITANFADLAAASQATSDDPTPETSPLQWLQHLLRNDDNNVPGNEQTRAHMSYFNAQVCTLAGQPGGGEGALDKMLTREAPSSTTSSGWKRLAELHHDMYFMAVPWEDPSARDYHKGLRHLDEYCRLLQGGRAEDVPNRELAYTFVKYAVCYNGIGRVVDAVRAVLRAVPLVSQAIASGECVDDMDAEEFDRWVYARFSELESLDVFLDRQNLAHPPKEVEEMTFMERSSMFVVMTRAKQIQQEKKRLEATFQEALKARARLEQTLARAAALHGHKP